MLSKTIGARRTRSLRSAGSQTYVYEIISNCFQMWRYPSDLKLFSGITFHCPKSNRIVVMFCWSCWRRWNSKRLKNSGIFLNYLLKIYMLRCIGSCIIVMFLNMVSCHSQLLAKKGRCLNRESSKAKIKTTEAAKTSAKRV